MWYCQNKKENERISNLLTKIINISDFYPIIPFNSYSSEADKKLNKNMLTTEKTLLNTPFCNKFTV